MSQNIITFETDSSSIHLTQDISISGRSRIAEVQFVLNPAHLARALPSTYPK